MNFDPRTDLAYENVSVGQKIEGTDLSTRQIGGLRILRLRIQTEEAAKQLGKPLGTYVTFECERLHRLEEDTVRLLCGLLAGELRGMAERLSGKPVNGDFGIFVAGLGNAELTADAIGPKTVGRLTATRHLREHEEEIYRSIGCASLSTLAPGVLGQTGIETVELLRGAVEHVKPDAIIVVDALAARSCSRLASTVQISDAGIQPGAGVGNHRAAITMKSVGVPVIVVGVPTVVNSATLVYDALQQAGIRDVKPSLERILENRRSFFVSPKDSDLITEHAAVLLSRAIEEAFVHPQ